MSGNGTVCWKCQGMAMFPDEQDIGDAWCFYCGWRLYEHIERVFVSQIYIENMRHRELNFNRPLAESVKIMSELMAKGYTRKQIQATLRVKQARYDFIRRKMEA